MNRTPDPQKYNMYAAFRTKERGEKKAREKRESIYELNRPKRNTAQTAQSRSSSDSPAGIYRVSRAQKPIQATQNANRGAQANARGSGNTSERQRQGGIYGTSVQAQGTRAAQHVGATRPSNDAQQINANRANNLERQRTSRPMGTYGMSTQGDAAQKRTASSSASLSPINTAKGTSNAPDTRRASAQQAQKKQPPVGTRVPSKGEDAYRYGFHSSYRTSDGRILDGFDKTGRPIYRESGGAAVVRHVRSDVDVAKLHPVRRIRVETLVDTKKKPFPFMLVFTMICCTAMVMGVLYSYMRLNECTNTLSTLNYRLGLLRNETNTLTAEVVRREDLIAIEQTAADTLGMVKNDVLTKRYVSIENEDKTEIFVGNVEIKDEHNIVAIDLKTGEILVEAEAETDETEALAK